MKMPMCAGVIAVSLILSACGESEPRQAQNGTLYKNLEGSKLKQGHEEPAVSGKNALFGSLEGSKLKGGTAHAPNAQE